MSDEKLTKFSWSTSIWGSSSTTYFFVTFRKYHGRYRKTLKKGNPNNKK